jgi:hypothetical protein
MDIQHDVIIALRMKHGGSEAEAWNVIVIGLPTDVICDVS